MAIISTVTGISFASTLKGARDRTVDPTTGRPYTQIRVGELVGFSDSQISKWEHGEGVPSPEIVNLLARYLDITVTEFVTALGFDLEPSALTEDERDLLAAYRRLPRNQQPGVRRAIRALHEPL